MPFTVDGLIWAASMVILDANRRKQAVPALAKWSLGVGIVATIGANVAHGLSHGIVGALISAWPAVALVGSFELAMTLTRTAATSVQLRTNAEQSPEEAIVADYLASLEGPGKPLSQRYLAEKHSVDRRKVKQILSTVAQPEPVRQQNPQSASVDRNEAGGSLYESGRRASGWLSCMGRLRLKDDQEPRLRPIS